MFRLFLVVGILLSQGTALACSSGLIPSGPEKLFIKSYDWHIGTGVLTVNKRNVAKTSLQVKPTDNAISWTSQWGSLTFNQHGREFPLGGINEKGLAIEILWLEETQYPEADDRASLNELQWIQYQLDNFDTVKELALKADLYRVSDIAAKVHYIACDSSGDCATFEYLGKQLKKHPEATSPLVVPILTNNTYEESIAYLKKHSGFGGNRPIPQGNLSLARFARAASLAQQPSVGWESGFDVLDSVRSVASQWQIVYGLSSKEVRVKTKKSQAIKTINSAQFDYSCLSPVKVLDVNSAAAGDVTARFEDFSDAENLKMIQKGFNGIGVALPQDADKMLAAYPSTTRCTE